MSKQRKSGPGKTRATLETAKSSTQSSHGTDVELDLALVGAHTDIWAALFNGTFRLAVRCDVCERWLTAGKSKSAGRGPSCSARSAVR